MRDDAIWLKLERGHVVLEQTYVYCWFHPDDGKILYVGATWMHPAARTTLHLHGIDEQARIVGPLLAQLGIAATENMRVVALPVSDDLDRKVAKHLLINRLHKSGLLSDSYSGGRSTIEREESATDPRYAGWIAAALEIIQGSYN